MNKLKILLLVIAVFMAVNSAKRIFEDDEAKVKMAVHRAKTFLEKKNLLGLADAVSADYYDEFGNDRRAVLLAARDFFDDCKSLAIKIEKLDVKIEDKNAFAGADAVAYWTEEGLSSIFYDSYKTRVFFRKEDGVWKVIKLEFLEPEHKIILGPRVG